MRKKKTDEYTDYDTYDVPVYLSAFGSKNLDRFSPAGRNRAEVAKHFGGEAKLMHKFETAVDKHSHRGLARKFFEKRFGRKPSDNEAYFNEWVDRFNSQRPEDWMDSKSIKVYEEVL